MHLRVVVMLLWLAAVAALSAAACSEPGSEAADSGGGESAGAVTAESPALPTQGVVMDFTAVVERCGDGDSLDVRGRDGTRDRLRLHGIDCPELAQAHGPEAQAATEAMVLGREVRVLVLDTDRYGRLVSLVVLPDGSLLNEELVRQGQAWVYGHHCVQDFCSRWFEEEQAARSAELGLWAAGDPEPPWDWRRVNGRN